MTRRFKKFFSVSKMRTPDVSIRSMKDLVKCSFVAQVSSAYLDLSLCEFSNFKKKGKEKCMDTEYLSDRNRSNHLLKEWKVFYTEESCKKYLATNRKLLYQFHLDVSKELELSLRNVGHQKIRKCYSESVLLNKIVFESDLYEKRLDKLITETLEKTIQKVKLIKKLAKIANPIKFIANNRYLIDKGLIFLCFQRADSIAVKDFLTAMNFDDDYFFALPIDVFEFVLYHANQTGYNLWSNLSCNDPINASIQFQMFVKTETLFQYFNAPRFCDDLYSLEVNCRWLATEEALKVIFENKLLTKTRYFLILQILTVFLNRSIGLKALQMLWRSISDPFITFTEFSLTLPGIPVQKFTELTCSFMPAITREDVLEGRGLQPRKLKHYCRTVIRRVLCDNRQLSIGFGKLKLPTSLESYLSLEN